MEGQCEEGEPRVGGGEEVDESIHGLVLGSDGGMHEGGPVADQPFDLQANELLGALQRVDRPGEDDVGELVELPDGPRVEQPLVDRDALEPATAMAAQQAPELARAAD